MDNDIKKEEEELNLHKDFRSYEIFKKIALLRNEVGTIIEIKNFNDDICYNKYIVYNENEKYSFISMLRENKDGTFTETNMILLIDTFISHYYKQSDQNKYYLFERK